MRKISVILLVLVLAFLAWLCYFSNIILPTEIRTLVVETLEEATQKKVILGSINFNIFKGLVIKDLIIYDGNIAIFNSKEVSCAILVFPVFKKHVIIPVIRIKAPDIFIERRPDNTINILDPFSRKTPFRPKHDFSLSVHRIALSNGHVTFHDGALDPVFMKELNDVNMNLSLRLGARLKFDLKFGIPSEIPVRVTSSGEYDIFAKALNLNAQIKDLALKEFAPYYNSPNLPLPDGRLDLSAGVKYKDDVVDAKLETETKELVFPVDKITARLVSTARANIRYNIKDKKLSYFGNLNIGDMAISGIPDIGEADKIKGVVVFSDSIISSDSISANVLGLGVNAKIKIGDLRDPNPAIDINIISDLALDTLQKILKERFKIRLPAEFNGAGKLDLELRYKMPFSEPPSVNGSLGVSGASGFIAKNAPPIETIDGTIYFTSNQLKWSDLEFGYSGSNYRMSGTLTNFETPGVQMRLSSKDLSLESVFAVNNDLINFSKLSGRYHDIGFSVTGQAKIADPLKTESDMTGTLDIPLEDIGELFKDSKEKIAKIKPKGDVRAEFTLKGNIRDLRSCAIDTKLSSPSLSLYDFKLSDVSINYTQSGGMGELLSGHSSLYGGTVDFSGKADLRREKFPYSLNADIKGMKLERLKMDTAFRKQDMAGTVNVKTRMSGIQDDPAKLEGFGKIDITGGKLWQLNLFKGMGVMLFSSDFSNIIFSDGYCNFLIKDSSVFTDDLDLKSDVIIMRGSVKIGFDNSIDASLKAEIMEEAIEASNTVRRITKAIGKYSIIGITGTMKEPKYTIKADMADIMEDLAIALFRR